MLPGAQRLRVSNLLVVIATLVPATSRAQLPLGAPARVNVVTTGDQRFPAVAMRDDGRFTVVWEDDDGSQSDILQRSYQSDGTPFSPSPLNQVTADIQERPAIAMNALGTWVATWSSANQVPGSLFDLFARRSVSNIIGSEFQVNDTDTHNASFPQLAVADDGSFVVVWTSGTSSPDVYARRFDAGGSPLAGDLVANQTVRTSTIFDVAAAPDGSFVVAWAGADDAFTGAIARCFDPAGVALSDDFVANENQGGAEDKPRLAMDAQGAFIVGWRVLNPSHRFRRFGPDCLPRSGDLTVEEPIGGTVDRLRFDMAPDGAFVAVWRTSQGDANEGIAAREFTKNGTPVGGQFLVNTDLAPVQDLPDVAIGADTFAVVWQERPTGGDDDVWVRRFRRRVVFTDDFESGDAGYWSATSP